MTPEKHQRLLETKSTEMWRYGGGNLNTLNHDEARWLISELETSWAENEKMREALSFYADSETYKWIGQILNVKTNQFVGLSGVLADDKGDRARKALGGE